MFGGPAFLPRGGMCCGIVGSDLMVRAPMDVFDALLRRRHVKADGFHGHATQRILLRLAPEIPYGESAPDVALVPRIGYR